MKRFPSESEGLLTRRKAGLVSARNLAEAGRLSGLDSLVRLGEELKSEGCPASVAADVIEAVIGAVYRDGGLEEAAGIVENMVLLSDALREAGPDGDAKSRLQEKLQSEGMNPPEYCTYREEGPDHEPLFRATVSDDGKLLGEGTGSSKRRAQQSAAEDALLRMEGEEIHGLSSV